MRYFIDMIVGILIEFMIFVIVDIFYYPSIFWTQFVMGVLFPCLMLGIYSVFRYGIVKEKPATQPYVLGNMIGYILELEVLDLIETYYPEHFILQIAKGSSINSIGESLYYGLCVIPLVVIIPIVSSIFLDLLWRSKPLHVDAKEEKKGESLGFAVCFPVMAYWCIVLVLQEYPKEYPYEEIANLPTIVWAWLLGLSVCLFVILIAYWVESGKNIRTVLILYSCEAMIFFACIKIFHLNFPASPLAGLGGTIVLGAGIYKGLEKLFAFVKERWE